MIDLSMEFDKDFMYYLGNEQFLVWDKEKGSWKICELKVKEN